MKRSNISFGLTMAFAMLAIASPAFAIQPWENGVFTLKERINKLDEALTFNFENTQAEYQTETDHLRLLKERDALIHQREALMRQLEASERIRNSTVVTYMAPAGNGFNTSLHTEPQAAR